ncbi:MAG: glycerol-3-phosphate dehydrogenase [Rhodoplanes sp.]
MADFDLAVIGAGATGAAIARDAAGRGIKVLLLDRNDLSSGASFGPDMLVRRALHTRSGAIAAWRAALAEREVMLATAPHLARAQRIVLLPQESNRSALALRGRLFAGDHLAKRRILPASQTLNLTHHVFGTALRRQFDFGFAYSDCRIDEVRLPLANARDAADHGAAIRTRTRLYAERGEEWTLVLNARGERRSVTARVLANAAGASVNEVAARLAVKPPFAIRSVKESYIVARRAFDHDGGYLLPDRHYGRYVLALPFAEDSMLIGPTEQDHSGDAAAPAPAAADIASLCALANHYFRRAIQLDDVTPFARVRVVAAAASCPWTPPAPHRLLHLDAPRGLAPLLTVGDGPVVLARRLAEAALDQMACFFAGTPSWTTNATLPGGEFTPDALEALAKEAERRWPFLRASHARRLVSSYGARLERILGGAAQSSDLSERFGADLTAAEVRYLMREEWAETADDILWRRSALGFGFAATEREALAQFMAAEQSVGSRSSLGGTP